MSAPLFDWDGTLAPQIKGNATKYRAALKTLGPSDRSPLARRLKGKVDIATARPEAFHADIRAAAKRMGLEIGDIHAAGFDKTETVKRLGRPLIDNNEDVVAKIHRNLGKHMATLCDTHEKQADSWLERWLAMFAARDAAHQADPARDATTTKLLAPLMPLGVPEAINNHTILGNTAGERRDAMRDAVQDVKDDTYGGALMRGLRSAPSYVLAGGLVGAASPAVTAAIKGTPQSGRAIGTGALTGAGAGVLLALLRPVLQKAILENTSNKAQRKAIDMKAENPVLTALPLGDMIGAAKSARRRGVNRFDPAKLKQVLDSVHASKPDSAFPAKELAKGTEHEKEHTSNPGVAEMIAKDHVAEDPKYYTKLEKTSL